MGNKSGKRWNADHIVTTNTLVMINRKLLGAVMTDTTSLRLSQMPKKVNLRWNIDSPQRCTLPLPSLAAGPSVETTRGFYQRQEDLMNIHVAQHCWRRNRIRWDQRREIPVVREHTSTLVRYSMHAWCCCSLFLSSSSDIPPAHAHPTVENATHMHTHGLRSTYMLSCLRGLAGGYCALLTFFFLREALCSAKPDTVCSIIQHQPGRAVGCYSNVYVSLDSLWWIHFRTAASPSHYWPINPAHTLGL